MHEKHRTSVLVGALTNDPSRRSANVSLRNSRRHFSIKIRTGQIDARHRAEALAAFTRLSAESFESLPVSSAQFRTAVQYALGLRAGDALHLAVAVDHGATIATLDHRLADAATALGVSVRLLEEEGSALGSIMKIIRIIIEA